MEQFTFTLTKSETDLIGAALGEMPYKVSSGLIDKLRAQAYVQMNRAVDEATPPVVSKEENGEGSQSRD